MTQILDWLFSHAIALTGGVLLVVAVGALIAGRRTAGALPHKNPREGE